ncbi:hypothetical protein OG599_09675 [Streptomyces sp. NBC_01335]|nr:hypothetical protein OG599_09675 [Streptomyces sp. NBC_01335]
MSTTEKPLTAGDRAYRVWIIHTEQCATCRAGRACTTAVRLGRAWRAVR